jgi:hypothetical protein
MAEITKGVVMEYSVTINILIFFDAYASTFLHNIYKHL